MTQVVPSEAEQTELMEISMGPQHPSTHGVFRMDVRLDGERGRKNSCPIVSISSRTSPMILFSERWPRKR